MTHNSIDKRIMQ